MPLYNALKLGLLNSTYPDLDAAGTELKVMLMSAYTPNIDTHATITDVLGAGTEESGTGYTAGGKLVANKAATQDSTNDRAVLDGDNVTWTGLDVGTPSHAVLYYDSGTDGTSLTIGYWAVTTASNGGDWTLSFSADGIIHLT